METVNEINDLKIDVGSLFPGSQRIQLPQELIETIKFGMPVPSMKGKGLSHLYQMDCLNTNPDYYQYIIF